MVYHLRRCQDFYLWEGLNDGLQTKIEIWIAGGDHNSLQRFTAGANHLHQLFTIFGTELGVKQNRLFWARHQRRRNRENSFILWIIDVQL